MQPVLLVKEAATERLELTAIKEARFYVRLHCISLYGEFIQLCPVRRHIDLLAKIIPGITGISAAAVLYKSAAKVHPAQVQISAQLLILLAVVPFGADR